MWDTMKQLTVIPVTCVKLWKREHYCVIDHLSGTLLSTPTSQTLGVRSGANGNGITSQWCFLKYQQGMSSSTPVSRSNQTLGQKVDKTNVLMWNC